MNIRMLTGVLGRVLVILLLLGGALMHRPGAAPMHAAPAEAGPTVENLPLPVQYALSGDLSRDDPAYHLTANASGATLRTLPAWLATDGHQVLVQVDDAGAAYPVVVNTWVQAAKLTASDGADWEGLGSSVATSADGNTIVVGAPHNAAGGSERGAVYVYTRPHGGWAATAAFTAKLTAGDGADWDGFGQAVAVSGDGGTVVGGAPYNGGGALYVYCRPETGWASTAAFSAKLTATDAAEYDRLGWSVSVSADADTIVGGAPDAPAGGAVYVYTRPGTGWATTAAFTAKLTASDGAYDDLLGQSVAVSADDNTVVAGAPNNDGGGFDRGAVYVYARPGTGWTTTVDFTAKLTASDAEDWDDFGQTVAVSGDGGTLAAGSAINAAGGSARGAVYVYARPETGWATTAAFTAKLTASDGADNDLLGSSVAMSHEGKTVVAGAPYNGGGAAYVYARAGTGWTSTAAFTAKLTASDGEALDLLGDAIAVSAEGGTVVGGAPANRAGGVWRGAAYVWAVVRTPPAASVFVPLVVRNSP